MSSHATPTPKPVPGAGGSVEKIFFVIAAILFLIWGYRSCSNKIKNNTSSGSAPTAVKIYEVRPDGSLILRRTIESLPDTATFDYKFEIETQGQPIKLKFPGIGIVKFSGVGRTLPVKGRHKGLVKLWSDK